VETGGGPITGHCRAREGPLESGSHASPRRTPELTLHPLDRRVIQTHLMPATLSLQRREQQRAGHHPRRDLLSLADEHFRRREQRRARRGGQGSVAERDRSANAWQPPPVSHAGTLTATTRSRGRPVSCTLTGLPRGVGASAIRLEAVVSRVLEDVSESSEFRGSGSGSARSPASAFCAARACGLRAREPRCVEPLSQRDSSVVTPWVFVVLR
jgi:hypothetical protein